MMKRIKFPSLLPLLEQQAMSLCKWMLFLHSMLLHSRLWLEKVMVTSRGFLSHWRDWRQYLEVWQSLTEFYFCDDQSLIVSSEDLDFCWWKKRKMEKQMKKTVSGGLQAFAWLLLELWGQYYSCQCRAVTNHSVSLHQSRDFPVRIEGKENQVIIRGCVTKLQS